MVKSGLNYREEFENTKYIRIKITSVTMPNILKNFALSALSFWIVFFLLGFAIAILYFA